MSTRAHILPVIWRQNCSSELPASSLALVTKRTKNAKSAQVSQYTQIRSVLAKNTNDPATRQLLADSWEAV